MQVRYYDPVIDRFYSNDPIGFTGEVDTFNRYSYVANNPYKYTDPTGMYKNREEDPLCTVYSGEGGKREEQNDEAYDKAVNTQISLTRQTRDVFTKVDSDYSNTAAGGYIAEGTSFFSNDLTLEGYTLSVINIRAAEGLVPEPGIFGGDLNQIQTGSDALVIAPKRAMSLEDIQDNSTHYNYLSNIIKAPVFVISNKKTVYKYTPNN